MKKLIVCGAAFVAAVAFTGCRMCTDPLPGEINCIEPSHYSEVQVRPNALALTKPSIAGSRELFRPVFKAGVKRITVVGEGTSRRAARNDAIAKFLKTADCDYIVGVTTIVTQKTHPTWRLFATTNYTVTLSGFPIHLEKLSCETISDEKADKITVNTNGEEEDAEDKGEDKTEDKAENKADNKADNNDDATDTAPHTCKVTPALVKLSDIRVNITANGATDDKAGVVFPIQ